MENVPVLLKSLKNHRLVFLLWRTQRLVFPVVENPSRKLQLEVNEIDLSTVERDPGGKMRLFESYGEGTECTSFHNIAQKAYDDLLNEERDIQNIFEKFTEEDGKNNRLILMATTFLVRWCAFQAVVFIGHDESSNSINKENFHEMLKAFGFLEPTRKNCFSLGMEGCRHEMP
uniref:DUF4371 domain-containing protein n=1 Tax=Lactuca sativa TaxID=4236 RepID=A0A9R1XCH4_LACSA|nr:hypothetical protein LSAT_V11C500284980 [Lactuca sativa]